MKELLGRLTGLEREVSEEKGGFGLLALLLRRDANDRWDLIASAEWIDRDPKAAMEYLAEKLAESLIGDDFLKIDRIVPLPTDHSRIQGLQADLRSQGLASGHGIAPMRAANGDELEIRNVDFSSEDIIIGYVLALRTESHTTPLPLSQPD